MTFALRSPQAADKSQSCTPSIDFWVGAILLSNYCSGFSLQANTFWVSVTRWIRKYI